nr:transposon Ty3-I Gag-Pol polyprotein [Tanacetum cinerariifolium]
MYHDLKQHFWWSGMKGDVAMFVSKCLICQQVKIEHQRASSLLQPLDIPVWKWDEISMDFVIGLPRTQKRHDAIWVRERVIKGPEMIKVTNAKVTVAKEKLKEARTCQKSYADKHQLILIICPKVEMSRDVLTVGSTMRIPLLYRGEYSQWVERFMNYLEEQTDGEAMINSIKNGDQPLPRVTQVSIAGTTSTEQPPLKDKSMCNKTAKDLWDALTRHMLGSEYGFMFTLG